MRCPCCGTTGPCYCFRNQSRPPARPRNTAQYRRPPARRQPAPAYRRPPRNDGGLIAFDLGCLGVLLVAAAISGIASWIAANHAAIVKNLPVIIAAPAIIAVTVTVVVIANRRQDRRPPKGRLQVEATTPRPVPQPPACQHVNAVKVDSVLDRQLVWQCWCPDCDPDCKTPLPANFRRPCCGTEPEAPHLYHCPHRKPGP